ncbi:RNA polymerase sigma factor, sigma-70 family [Longilinea arvoryzae]|uniref:RNA polymerase sigma factor n=1 Tax=Longilinea arvoryzae TaxID=360412 RepID=A0A0S7B9Q0_9CHLR|nr:sigma-70 family RNA polymerase sigma factor [Longilinea arvoryzae]GAP14135.1 RNA polymerase sigma factor, sigma-70 family [Longilinea arvoryzae]
MSEPEHQPISIEALKRGDRAEFARLVDAYSTHIYRLALRMLADPQDAEDVLQETFIKAMRALPAFEGRSSLSTWLYRIAVNEALMMVRKRKPEVSLSTPAEDDDDEENGEELQIVDWGHLPESELLSGESRRHIDQAVENLPQKLKVVFLLRDVEGLSIEDAAATLGISQAAVKTRLLRARLQLRDALSSYYRERMKEK